MTEVLEQARAHLEAGEFEEAADAFRRALNGSDDTTALVDGAHAAFASGNTDEAIAYLERAVDVDSANVEAARALSEMYGRAGRSEDALRLAGIAAEHSPDPDAVLDVAERALELDRLPEAAAAFRRLLELEEEPEHAIYAYHGLIEAEIRRENWRRALDLAIEATRIDRLGRTTDLLAYVVARVFGTSDRPAPTRTEVDDALASSRTEHRRLHEESLVL